MVHNDSPDVANRPCARTESRVPKGLAEGNVVGVPRTMLRIPRTPSLRLGSSPPFCRHRVYAVENVGSKTPECLLSPFVCEEIRLRIIAQYSLQRWHRVHAASIRQSSGSSKPRASVVTLVSDNPDQIIFVQQVKLSHVRGKSLTGPDWNEGTVEGRSVPDPVSRVCYCTLLHVTCWSARCLEQQERYPNARSGK